MNTNNTRLSELLDLYFDDLASENEKSELWDYLDNPLFSAELEELISEAYNKSRDGEGISQLNQQAILDRLFAIEVQPSTKIKSIKLWPRIAVAASITLAIITGGYFYYNIQKQNTENIAYKNDIAPGKNGATLTLANGKKIRLTDALNGKLAEEAGVVISKTADGQLIYEIKENQASTDKINTLSTSNGETYQVRLPDGTAVWLNAASSISYPASFASLKERKVELEGEAYFEVAKDKMHPFIVKSSNQEVEVLGTHFNINSYNNEEATRTTLLEGSVKVNGKVLTPNEQSILANNIITIQNVDVDDVIAWKNGIFLFEDEALNSIMRKVERWYDVEIIFDSKVNQSTLYSGGVSRYDNVSKVLETITTTGNIHFKIEGRRIKVMK